MKKDETMDVFNILVICWCVFWILFFLVTGR